MLYDKSSFAPLSIINNIRFNYIKSKTSFKNKTALDIGCGVGLLSEKIALHGSMVLGIDQSLPALMKSDYGVKYLNINLSEFHSACKYDIIVCMEVLEHLKNLNIFFNVLESVTKSGTIIFISSLKKEFLTYIKYIFFGEYILSYLKKGTHNYINFYNIYDIFFRLNYLNIYLYDIKFIKYNYFLKHSVLDLYGDNYILCFYRY